MQQHPSCVSTATQPDQHRKICLIGFLMPCIITQICPALLSVLQQHSLPINQKISADLLQKIVFLMSAVIFNNITEQVLLKVSYIKKKDLHEE